MRWVLGAWVVLVGCSGDTTCEGARCEAVCDEFAAAQAAEPVAVDRTLALDDRVLMPWEWEILGDTVRALREGISVSDDEGFGLCRGAIQCEEWLDRSPRLREAGPYLLKARVQVPPAGTWPLRFEHHCAERLRPWESSGEGDGLGEPFLEVSKLLEVRASASGEPVEFSPLLRIRVPMPGERDVECWYSLTQEGVEDGFSEKGHYLVPR